MQIIRLRIVLSVAFAISLPSIAWAQPIDDPVECGRAQFEKQPEYKVVLFEHFLTSLSDPSVRFLGDNEMTANLVPIVGKCAEHLTDEQEQLAILALGIVGDQMLIEGRQRLRELKFDSSRFDDLFLPALRDMPLDALNLLTFRPPDELREPAFALRDEIIEQSGKSKEEVTSLLIAYTTGLVGVEASRRVVAELSETP
ncbi:hypothetical protein [uncultured Erythrobacter sp.]|uniref:hypothetical protein n=1 Tax=uncultured Erythrobacter sp. TaxID=263913 RepID=UPI00262816AE|nr:hypothetical protein [uncultured Erythrobacter sp.]